MAVSDVPGDAVHHVSPGVFIKETNEQEDKKKKKGER
jgi:hypothetical protein